MKGAKRQAIILGMLVELREIGSWCGETHVQKSCHFLQDGLEVPLDVDFIMYKHGPFSFDLRELLGELRASQLLDVEPRPPYGPNLQPTDSGRSLLSRFPNTLAKYSTQIRFVAENLGPRDVVDLERIGTALYVTRDLPNSTAEERASEVCRLKPRLDKEAALAAVTEVDALLSSARKVHNS